MSISAINIGLSGMQSYQKALDSSAHNIANTNTNAFKPQSAQFQEEKTGGVVVNISQNGSQAAAAATAAGSDSAVAGKDTPSGTELSTEIVNSISYKAGFDLSAKIVKTGDELLGSLINIRG